MLKKFFVVICLVGAGWFGSGGVVSASEADLFRLLSQFETYQARFDQQVMDSEGQVIDQSEGLFALKKPNRFRWQIDLPFEQQIVSDGENLWVYDIDLEQVTVQSLQQVLSNTPALLLSISEEEMRQSFQVTIEPAQVNKQVFRLIPKNEDSLFESILLTFDHGSLVQLNLNDTLGQQTFVRFDQVFLNKEIVNNTFEFSLPEGVDFIDSRNKGSGF